MSNKKNKKTGADEVRKPYQIYQSVYAVPEAYDRLLRTLSSRQILRIAKDIEDNPEVGKKILSTSPIFEREYKFFLLKEVKLIVYYAPPLEEKFIILVNEDYSQSTIRKIARSAGRLCVEIMRFLIM